MRILIDLPPEQVEALTTLAERRRLSRAALIREALARFLGTARPSIGPEAFGLWGDHAVDGLAYQEKVRGEW